jgi:[ribosomal protein S18]-alanine N-acetyltransferase
MAQIDAEAVARWHYPEPFSFYDWTADPGDLAELLEAGLRGGAYFAVDGDGGDLAGYFSFKQKDEEIVEVGLGLRPDLSGQGLGEGFVSAGLEYALGRLGPAYFSLAVAAFNRRAIKVYERVGFTAVRTYMHTTNGADWEFVEMRRTA